MGIFDKIKDVFDHHEDEQPSTETAATPVEEAVATAEETVAEATTTVEETVAETVAAVEETVAPVTEPVTEAVAAVEEAAAPVVESAPVAAVVEAKTYTVESGDNLTWISERFGVSVAAIAQANGIENPDLIFPGQVLTIPA
ncbi:MAG: LysM peptidoglycan-binding domain-containing protein [Propionibacteriaceae bacterium]